MKEEQTKFDTKYIVVNMAQCLKCKDVIQSNSVHDYVTCSCGNLSIDGGQDYLRRAFKHSRSSWKELSIFKPKYSL